MLLIRLERVARNLRSYELAQLLGVDSQQYYKYESGAKPVPPEVAAKASKLLGKTVDELFNHVAVIDRNMMDQSTFEANV